MDKKLKLFRKREAEELCLCVHIWRVVLFESDGLVVYQRLSHDWNVFMVDVSREI